MRIAPSYSIKYQSQAFKSLPQTVQTGLEDEPVYTWNKNATVDGKLPSQIKKEEEQKDSKRLQKAYIAAASGAFLLGMSAIYVGTLRKYENKLFNEISHLTQTNPQEIIKGLKNKIQELKITTADNVKLDCWNVNPSNSNKYVIFCNGSGCSKTAEEVQNAYQKFADAGYGVLAFDYRGTGKSAGKFSESGVFKDIEAIFNHLKKQGIEEKNIGIAGHSLGTAIAADFAAVHKTAFTMLINPFTKASELAKESVKYFKFPTVVKKALENIPARGLPLKNNFNTIGKIDKIDSPLFIIHAADDTAIPVQMAQKLAQKANSANTTYVELKEGGHFINDEKLEKCIEFLNKLFA